MKCTGVHDIVLAHGQARWSYTERWTAADPALAYAAAGVDAHWLHDFPLQVSLEQLSAV
jgi:hypothetical protein